MPPRRSLSRRTRTRLPGRAPHRSGIRLYARPLGEGRVHYHGAAGGVQIRTPLSLQKNPAPDALVLSTTLAIRYAIGFGDSRAADIDLTRLAHHGP